MHMLMLFGSLNIGGLRVYGSGFGDFGLGHWVVGFRVESLEICPYRP